MPAVLVPKPALVIPALESLHSRAFRSLTIRLQPAGGQRTAMPSKKARQRGELRLLKNPLRESASVHTATFLRGENAAVSGLGALPLKPRQEAVPPAPPFFSNLSSPARRAFRLSKNSFGGVVRGAAAPLTIFVLTGFAGRAGVFGVAENITGSFWRKSLPPGELF